MRRVFLAASFASLAISVAPALAFHPQKVHTHKQQVIIGAPVAVATVQTVPVVTTVQTVQVHSVGVRTVAAPSAFVSSVGTIPIGVNSVVLNAAPNALGVASFQDAQAEAGGGQRNDTNRGFVPIDRNANPGPDAATLAKLASEIAVVKKNTEDIKQMLTNPKQAKAEKVITAADLDKKLDKLISVLEKMNHKEEPKKGKQ